MKCNKFILKSFGEQNYIYLILIFNPIHLLAYGILYESLSINVIRPFMYTTREFFLNKNKFNIYKTAQRRRSL